MSTKEIETSGQEISDIEIVSQENSLANDYDIDGFLAKRAEFITKVNAIMVKGSDYHEIQGKKSLAKGGAEKIASIFGWTASFTKDQDVIESFKSVEGLVAFVCHLSKNSGSVGEGRGAAILGRNGGDPNKTIKMAQKSSFIDAVLRASGLSDFFTQDLEDMDIKAHTKYDKVVETPTTDGKEYIKPSEAQNPAPSNGNKEIKATTKQLGYIKGLMDKKAVKTVDINGYMFSTEDLQKLTISQAKTVIDKLLAMQDKESELPIINLDEQ